MTAKSDRVLAEDSNDVRPREPLVREPGKDGQQVAQAQRHQLVEGPRSTRNSRGHVIPAEPQHPAAGKPSKQPSAIPHPRVEDVSGLQRSDTFTGMGTPIPPDEKETPMAPGQHEAPFDQGKVVQRSDTVAGVATPIPEGELPGSRKPAGKTRARGKDEAVAARKRSDAAKKAAATRKRKAAAKKSGAKRGK
jgi:hypothetical protein